MELKTKLMFCGVNNLTDARYAAAIGSDWLGFDFDTSSPAFVDADKAALIKGWLSGPQYFGEFAGSQLKYIPDIQEKMQLDYVYIKDYPDVQDLAGLFVPVIKEIFVDPMSPEEIREAFITYSRHAKLFVVRSAEGNFSSIPEEMFKTYQVYLRMDFTPESAEKALSTFMPEGICLSGGNEDKAGLRDFEDLQRIVETLMID